MSPPTTDKTAVPISGLLGMFAAAAIWGTWVLILARVTLPGAFVPPITTASGALILLALVWLSGGLPAFRSILRDRAFVRTIARVALLEVIQNTLFIIAFSLAIRDGGSVVIPIIRSLAGVITPLVAAVSAREPFSPRLLLYGAAASAGAVLIFTRGGIALGQNLSYIALALVTISVILRGWYYVEQGGLAREMHRRRLAPIHVLTCHQTISALLLLPVLLTAAALTPLHEHPDPLGQMLFLAVFGLTHMALASILRLRSMRYLTAQQTIIIMYIEPVTSVLLSILFLGETVTLSFFVGALIILGAAGGASLHARRMSQRERA
jgi:drug/metabolite transporter (DMT)-like permease